jgi:VanZ family protein
MIPDKVRQQMTERHTPTDTMSSRAPRRVPIRPWRWLLGALTGVVFALAVMPAPPREIDTGWDKLNHVLAFAALAFVGVWAHGGESDTGTGGRRLRVGLHILLGTMGLGVLIEAVQAFVPGRSSDAADLVADGIGALAGGLLAWAVHRWGPVRA